MEPLICRSSLRRVKHTWLVQPSTLFWECFEILTDTLCTAGCYFCLVIKENTFLLWLTPINGNKSLSSAYTVANTHKPTQMRPWVGVRHGFGIHVLFCLSSRGRVSLGAIRALCHLQKVHTSTAAVMSCLEPDILIFHKLTKSQKWKLRWSVCWCMSKLERVCFVNTWFAAQQAQRVTRRDG